MSWVQSMREIPRLSQAFLWGDGFKVIWTVSVLHYKLKARWGTGKAILFKVRGKGLAVYFPCLPKKCGKDYPWLPARCSKDYPIPMPSHTLREGMGFPVPNLAYKLVISCVMVKILIMLGHKTKQMISPINAEMNILTCWGKGEKKIKRSDRFMFCGQYICKCTQMSKCKIYWHFL